MTRVRSSSLALLALALAAGAILRFYRLGAFEMSADEGASWAAAAAPSLSAVLRSQVALNPGKAGLHDVTLHLWMRAFGDGLVAMRALSAAAGLVAIALMFALTREALAPAAGDGSAVWFAPDDRDLAAAIAALLFAVNLVMVKYAREARMYPLEIAALMTTAYCLMCAMNRGGVASYAGAAIGAALALAAHLTALAALAAMGLWMVGVMIRGRRGWRLPDSAARRAGGNLVAIAVGAAMLAPLAPAVMGSAAHAAAIGAINWIHRPPWWAPFSLFNKATGTFAFPLYAALAGGGVIWGWRRARARTLFALVWMWAPPCATLAASYLLRPLFVERYLVSSFAPFFMLAALGVVALRRRYARAAAIALAVALAFGHLAAWSRKPHDVQWREAAAAARVRLGSGGAIVVAPGYAANVVRYYLRHCAAGVRVIPVAKAAGVAASIAIVGETGDSPAAVAALSAGYPRVVARARGVVVRER